MAGLRALGFVSGISPGQWPKPALPWSIPVADDLISFFKAIPDSRHRPRVRYPQSIMLQVDVLGILSGCVSGAPKIWMLLPAGTVTARKDDAPAAVQAAIFKVAGSSSISGGGGFIHTTSGSRQQRVDRDHRRGCRWRACS